jgi:hypothetical protein
MRLILAENVHAALVDDDCVLLDVGADAYFCLPAGEQNLTLQGRVIDAEPDILAHALCDAGLAHRATDIDCADPGLGAIQRPVRTARAALDANPDLKAARIWPRHWRALVRAIGVAVRARKQPFAARLCPLVGERPRLSEAVLVDLAAYRRLLPWLPIDGACLFRSEMLRAYLRALGHDATWTFGVRTWPFRAHCWLQIEDMALDDEAERLAAFHPIMAV